MMGLRRYEFSERLAEILGASRRDLRARVTMLVTQGLAAPGPRGPGSPPASPEYAAEFLIGVMAAPQQVHTVEAIRCFRELRPTAVAAEGAAPGITVGPVMRPGEVTGLPLIPGRLRFGETLARLLGQAQHTETRAALSRDLFGVWVNRGFPVAAVQFAAWSEGRRAVMTQRYELPEGGRPPAWLDPERGGLADPGLFHSVFLPVSKLIEIGRLTTSTDERRTPVLDLDQTISKLADFADIGSLADLVRNRRHRRPWEKFLSVAQKARAVAERIDARGNSHLSEVTSFGSNLGNLRMLTYVPQDLPHSAPLVVVLHGCTQTARSYDVGTGWSTLADRHGFALLLPEQRGRNNPMRCFNWFRSEDFTRESGESLSVRQMIDWMIANHRIDRHRIYVTGVSSGGAMTSVMLATYPDIFAGGAIIAGVPYGCANGLQEGFEVIFQGRTRSDGEWGTLVRSASPHPGPWPKISVWHGSADSTVTPMNAEEIIKQWTDVHGLGVAPIIETSVNGHRHRVWQSTNGDDLVEAYTINGMGHGVPIDPTGPRGCGAVAPFILDMGISSTHHIAEFWGLTQVTREPTTEVHRPTRDDMEADLRTDSGPDSASLKAGTEPSAQHAAGVGRAADLQRMIAKSLEAAGLGKSARDGPTGTGERSTLMPIVDIQKILMTSFEAAGLLKGGSSASSGVGQAEASGAAARGIDIAAILAKAFEAAGLLKSRRSAPPSEGEESNGLANSGWTGDGWQLASEFGDHTPDDPVLYGNVSSGTGGWVGDRARSVSRQFTMGDRPTLSYMRKLSLAARANVLTTARFRVLVDGVPVDEVSAVGMNYDEADWTARRDIDLARFANRKVTVSFEVSANSNVFVEVFARASVRGVTIQDASATRQA